jgi:hypothetical protein
VMVFQESELEKWDSLQIGDGKAVLRLESRGSNGNSIIGRHWRISDWVVMGVFIEKAIKTVSSNR